MWSLQEEGTKKHHPCSTMSIFKSHHIGGLDNVVDMEKASNEQLNVITSTNTVSRALREAGLGSLEKEKKPLLTAKNVSCRFRVYNV